ncbi:MAG: nucleotide exchange factor GrpE [Gloeobacterales cyanobacterium]
MPPTHIPMTDIDSNSSDSNAPAQEAESTELENALAQEVSRLVSQLDDLKLRLLEKDQQLQEKEQQYTRLYADFENYRRRTQREKDDLQSNIKADVLKEVLTVMDNFERAKSQIQIETEREETINDSYQAVYRQFLMTLEKLGVTPIEAQGKPFDPVFHEAVMQMASDEHTEETVLAEFQRGYVIGDKVLRHAVVKVATPTSTLTDQPSSEDAAGA